MERTLAWKIKSEYVLDLMRDLSPRAPPAVGSKLVVFIPYFRSPPSLIRDQREEVRGSQFRESLR